MSMIWGKDDFDIRSAAERPARLPDRSRQDDRLPFRIDLQALCKSTEAWASRIARICFPGAVIDQDPALCRLCQEPLGDAAAGDGAHESCGCRDACQY